MRLSKNLSLFIYCLFVSQLCAQVVPYTAKPSTSSSSSSTSSASPSQSLINFSMLSWRIGQLSPANASITTTSTSSLPQAPLAVTAPQDPFVAPAISLQGGLSNSSIITTTDTPSTIQTTPMGRWSFAPYFLRFNSLAPDHGMSTTVNTPIVQDRSSVSLFDVNKYDTSVQPLAMTVPEPGTLVLCGSMALAAGYFWLRRKPTSPAGCSEQEPTKDNVELCLSK